MGRIAECHVRAVSKQAHAVVLFDTGVTTLRWDQATQLKGLARQALDERWNVLLIGSASNLGQISAEDNDALSSARAQSVYNTLNKAGLGRTRLSMMGIGWQPPRLSNPSTAKAMRLQTLVRADRRHLDQNVIVVLYKPERS